MAHPHKPTHDTYSKMVRVLRWLLPLAAIILLASIFVLSNTNKLREGLINLPDEIGSLAFGQKITNPHFSGVTKSGDAFSISAVSALPDAPAPERIDLEEPSTTIDFQDGRQMQAKAGTGALNLLTSEALLDNGVTLETTNDLTAATEGLRINFETGNASSVGPVQAYGPMGSIEAGGMVLTQNLDRVPAGRAVLLFNNGVKLIYKPQSN